MSTLDFARYRLETMIAEIKRLKESEFPYRHSKDALDIICHVFEAKLQRLQSLTSKHDAAAIKTECYQSLLALFRYMPLLGFILRSTNVRNAFEVWGPLFRLSKALLDTGTPPTHTRLLISSEWNYSPLAYPEIPDLLGFVLMGLPASESSNPLIVSLAGHELGHSLWRQGNFKAKLPSTDWETVKVIWSKWKGYLNAFPFPKITKVKLITDEVVALEPRGDAIFASSDAEPQC